MQLIHQPLNLQRPDANGGCPKHRCSPRRFSRTRGHQAHYEAVRPYQRVLRCRPRRELDRARWTAACMIFTSPSEIRTPSSLVGEVDRLESRFSNLYKYSMILLHPLFCMLQDLSASFSGSTFRWLVLNERHKNVATNSEYCAWRPVNLI